MLSRLGILVLFISLITISSAHAQTSPLSQQQNETRWSVSLQGGFAMGASASMRESYTQFQSDVEKDYNNSGYPFGGPNGSGGSWDLSAEYDFLTSPFGIYAAVRTTLFSTSDASNNTADLSAGTLSLGAQYSHPFWRAFDFVVQGGINGSLLGGQVVYEGWKTKITSPNYRFGLEAGLGIDWYPRNDFFMRPFADYADLNLIGKSYTSPGTSPPYLLATRALNDGANPANPNDHARTIDYLLIGVALGVRF